MRVPDLDASSHDRGWGLGSEVLNLGFISGWSSRRFRGFHDVARGTKKI